MPGQHRRARAVGIHTRAVLSSGVTPAAVGAEGRAHHAVRVPPHTGARPVGIPHPGRAILRAVTTRRPSGLKAALHTVPVCPASSATGSAVCAKATATVAPRGGSAWPAGPRPSAQRQADRPAAAGKDRPCLGAGSLSLGLSAKYKATSPAVATIAAPAIHQPSPNPTAASVLRPAPPARPLDQASLFWGPCRHPVRPVPRWRDQPRPRGSCLSLSTRWHGFKMRRARGRADQKP